MKRTIEIEDNSQEIIESAIEDTKNLMLEWLDDNADLDDLESVETPCLHNDLDYSGSFHEIIDSAVPIYDSEINSLFFLYGDEITEVFISEFGKDAIQDTWPMGWKPAALYSWIYSKVCDHYHKNADDWVEQWRQSKTN